MPAAYVDYVPVKVTAYRDQARLLRAVGQPGGKPCEAQEITISAAPRSGASRAVMMLGVMIAQSTPGARVLVVGRDLPTMRADWADENGLWSFVRPLIAAGQAVVNHWYVGFPAIDSRLIFKMSTHARQVRDATHVLIDDAHELSGELLADLRDLVMSRPPLEHEQPNATRFVSVIRAGQSDWPGAAPAGAPGSKLVLDMLGDDLSAEMRQKARQVAERPRITLRDYITRAVPDYQWHYHSEILADTLQLAQLDRHDICSPAAALRNAANDCALPLLERGDLGLVCIFFAFDFARCAQKLHGALPNPPVPFPSGLAISPEPFGQLCDLAATLAPSVTK